MSHVDEGLIHAWLEDQLPPEEAARIEQLVATDPAWGSAAAEARGLIAASSRVLGALDSAPSAGVVVGTLSERTERTGRTEETRRTGRTGASWTRKPWLRAAAVVALVAGVSGVWFSNRDNSTVLDALSDNVTRGLATPTEGAGGSPPVAAPQTSPVERASPRVPALTPQASGATARSDVANQERGRATPPPVASTSVIPPTPPPATPPVASPPPVVARDEASGARAATAAKDAGEDRSVAGNAAGVGAAGGRGGRGGVAGLTERTLQAANNPAQRMESQVSEAMKAFAKTSGDSVQRGCWLPLDTQSPSRQANESARPAVMVLRFVPPVVTDLAAVAAPALARAPNPVAGAGASSAMRSVPASVRIQNTTAHPKDDSTLVAEWLNPDNRSTQLSFRVRGDTLRGTTSTITGNVVPVGSVLVAVRVQCPQ